ncbi:unnamed protein product [Paramecium pentaurelia]|uniref:Uncharacterized protein n=1 Tax=Paramecium pentaurelia TaxID=43138 RepID=A0A8S1U3S1_9CILI|nr:unnamed protein product [Paramecium pentaurelia]
MRIYALFVLLMYATALNFEASLMSHTLAEVDALDTSQLNCQTPRSHFDELEQTLTQWQNVLENKERIPSHIETLTEMKHLIKHKKYQQLVDKIKDLDLISPPVLSELQNKLQGLQSHDKHEREECTETLTKLCAYLIKQMNNVHQQCQQSPVTVIKVKGKIDDIKIIQSGCQQACQPTCPDEPVPEVPSEVASEEFTEEPVEEGVPPTTPDDEPTPDEPTPDDEPAPEDKPTPDAPEVPQEEEGPTDEPPVNPSSEESPEEPTVPEDGTEEWTIPGEEPEEPKSVPTTPDSPEEDQEETPIPPVSPDPQEFPEEAEEQFIFEETPLPPVSPDPFVFPEEEEEQFIFEETLPPVSPDPLVFPEEDEEQFIYEETLPPVSPDPQVFSEEDEEEFIFEETPLPPVSPDPLVFPEEAEEQFIFEETPVDVESPIVCHSSESTEKIELTATQVEPGFTSTLTITNEYGFGLYFQKLQKYPAFADGEEFHLASLQDNGNTVLGVFVTKTGVKCVTADGSTQQSTSVQNDDFEGDWSFVFISHGKGVTGCGVKFFEEQPALRQTPASHPNFSTLEFIIGGEQDSHPSFQGQVYGHFAVSAPNLHFQDEKTYKQIVDSCNIPPEEVCELDTHELGDFEFSGFDDNSEERYDFSTWDSGYSVSGWFKWESLQDQDVWHTVFRLSENTNADLDDIQLGDRDLALYLGNELVGNRYQVTTYTYSGSGNPNLWDSVEYGSTLGQWHYIYFGYSRRTRYANYAIYLSESEMPSNQIHDVRHYLVPQRRLYIGNDGLYPAFNGKFYNWRVNSCIGDVAIDVVNPPKDIIFGYNPQPEVPQIEPEVLPEEEPFWPEEEEEYVPANPEEVPFDIPSEEESIWPEEEEEFVPPPPTLIPEEESFWPEEEEEFIPVPPPEVPPVIPDEVNPEPIPEPQPQPEPEPAPSPSPKPAPGPAPPSEPQVPVVLECEATIDVTKENAADILCAISEYLAQLASGHVPELGINPSRVCFCLQYDDSESNEAFMQVEAILKENDAYTINKLVGQRRI